MALFPCNIGSSGGTAKLNQMMTIGASYSSRYSEPYSAATYIKFDIAMLKACGCSKFGARGSASGSSILNWGISYRVDSGSYTDMTSGAMYTIPNGTTLTVSISAVGYSDYPKLNDLVLLFS